MKSYTIIILFLILFLNNILKGQNDSIPSMVTDRPTQCISPILVPRGYFQIESGFIYTSQGNEQYKINELDVLGTLFRYGIFDNFEIRLFSSYSSLKYHDKVLNTDSTLSGLGPLSLGFKIHIVEEKGVRPELAIVADITLRHVGKDGFHPTYSYPVAKLVASNTLSNKFALGYNMGFAYDGESADGFFVYSIVLGYNISSKMVVFIEPYGNFDHSAIPNHNLNGGLTYLIRRNLQFDISGGVGLTDEVNENFISFGFSWRIPR